MPGDGPVPKVKDNIQGKRRSHSPRMAQLLYVQCFPTLKEIRLPFTDNSRYPTSVSFFIERTIDVEVNELRKSQILDL